MTVTTPLPARAEVFDVVRAPRGAWMHDTAAEMLEALVARGLLPDHWLDPERGPTWTCARCRGLGFYRNPDGRPAMRERYPMLTCPCDRGSTVEPRDRGAVVAAAAIGRAAASHVESVVAEAWPSLRLSWDVRTPNEVLNHHHSNLHRGARHILWPGFDPSHLFSYEERAMLPNARWPKDCPVLGESAALAASWWPPLRAVASLGLHVMRASGQRLVVAVAAERETVGGVVP